ncbi:DUF6196 family protein [Pendulispora albinea]|uniref:DUF6196 family protein n=1 Tax=Pendulispora albinea TaxID=2741071 RepID=A0ABZ2M3R4_9BACT
MYVSHESPEQTHTRLRRVLAEAELKTWPGLYAFDEVPAAEFPAHLVEKAFAFVRDEDVWSALVPATRPEQERFVVFSFHFTPGLDNSGFVGWLASHLKAKVGTGVMVVCGQNSARGGIFDYWGAPESVADRVLAEVQRLRGEDAKTGGAP